MRIMRGKSYEGRDGHWEKIEVELETQDLLEDEKKFPEYLWPILLELRAEQHIIMFMLRNGKISKEDAKAKSEELKAVRRNLTT